MTDKMIKAFNVCKYIADAVCVNWYWLIRNLKYGLFKRNEEFYANKLVVAGHILEKGITMPNRHYGFGYGVVQLLIQMCNDYIRHYGNKSSQLHIALDDLREYAEIHHAANYALPDDISKGIESLLSQNKLPRQSDCKQYSEEQFFSDPSSSDFYAFAHSRHTCRWYSDKEVSEELIKKVVELANTAPSACNRQSVRVYCLSGEAKQKVLDLQNGHRGFGDHINKLFVVTFRQPSWTYDTQYGGYFDAGIYTMNLLYALHYHKLCACTLNACMKPNILNKVRVAAGIPDCEVPTVFIAVGHPLLEMMIAKSERLPICDILSLR